MGPFACDKMLGTCIYIYMYTPLKFNMEPDNQPLGKEIPFGNHHFEVPYESLGVYIYIYFKNLRKLILHCTAKHIFHIS